MTEAMMVPCLACGAPMLVDANYCARCGRGIGGEAKRPPPTTKWYHNTWFVLFLISPVALGPFGLPLLWKSPRFSSATKIWLTAFTILWTILLVWYVLAVMVPVITEKVNQLNSVFSF